MRTRNCGTGDQVVAGREMSEPVDKVKEWERTSRSVSEKVISTQEKRRLKLDGNIVPNSVFRKTRHGPRFPLSPPKEYYDYPPTIAAPWQPVTS